MKGWRRHTVLQVTNPFLLTVKAGVDRRQVSVRGRVTWRNGVDIISEHSFQDSLNCKAAGKFYTEFNEKLRKQIL